MPDIHTNRHELQRASTDADQLELSAILSGPQVFERGAVDDRISGAIVDLEDQSNIIDISDFQRQDLETESATGKIAEEIQRRKSIMGSAYPFSVTPNGITYSASASRFYEFCLATVSAPNITTGQYVQFPRKFERATTVLIQMFFGNSTQALHLGAPRDPAIGKTFKRGMQTLAARSGEWQWSPEPDLPLAPTTNGDEGIDFVVWHSMLDKRQGALFVLGQCACGGDWVQKWHDLEIARLKKWFRPMTSVDPVRAFATPFHVVDGMLVDAMRSAGLVFDRARLAMIAERYATDPRWEPWPTVLESISALVFPGGLNVA